MTTEFAWSDGRRDAESFFYEHVDYELTIAGTEIPDDDTDGWQVLLLTTGNKELYEISAHEETRVSAEKTALRWAVDHEPLAGFRLNDGVEVDETYGREVTVWSKAERERAVDDLEDWGFGEGCVFYNPEVDGYMRVVELSPDGFIAEPMDLVCRRNYGVLSTYIAEVADLVEKSVFYPLNQTTVQSPLETLVEFTEAQLHEELADASLLSTYEGVSGVERLADLMAAIDLGKRELAE